MAQPPSTITGLSQFMLDTDTQFAQNLPAHRAKFPLQTYVAPTIALSAAGAGTGITNGVTFAPFDRVSNPTRLFPYFGFAGGKLVQATYTASGRDWVKIPVGNTNTFSAPMVVCFDIDSLDFEVLHVGQSAPIAIYVDDVLVLRTRATLRSAAATGGGATTITLDASASATTGFYVGYDIAITAGTGSGQRLCTAYNGSTKVATVQSAWAVNPIAGDTFDVRVPGAPFSSPGSTGSLYRIRLTFTTKTVRRVRIETNGYFPGVTAGPNDGIWAAPASNGLVCMVLGDSYTEPTGAFGSCTGWGSIFCNELGFHPIILGMGGTGYLNPSTGGKANFKDRLVPDANSFWYDLNGATGGTFTISVTTGGSTSTTSAIAYNATIATIQAAIEGLSNVGAGNVEVFGPWTARYFAFFRNTLATATLTFSTDGASLTGGASAATNGGTWEGEIAYHRPLDGQARKLPFVIALAGGYNDTPLSDVSYTPAALNAQATEIIARIKGRFPEAMLLMVGPWSPSATINSDLANAETTLNSVADNLVKINGTKPYIKMHNFITGTGRVGVETGSGTADLYTNNDQQHPFGDRGHRALGMFAANSALRIFGAQVKVLSGWISGT